MEENEIKIRMACKKGEGKREGRANENVKEKKKKRHVGHVRAARPFAGLNSKKGA